MKIYLFYLLLLLSTNVLAQRYPVQSSMHISAPYSVFLSDYTSVGSQKLQMQLFLSDATVSDIDVKFRISIKGEGVEITILHHAQLLLKVARCNDFMAKTCTNILE